MRKSIIVFLIVVFFLTLVLLRNPVKEDNVQSFRIVTSFYPINIIVKNLTEGAENIEVVNMTEKNMGCIHDYVLTTNDMKRIENANILIENGWGLENFTEKIKSVYPNVKVLDSSENIPDIISDDGEANPHIWTSISNYIKQVENISNILIEEDAENEEIYIKNTQQYISELRKNEEEYRKELKKLEGKKVLILNEALEYVAKDLKMEFISIHTDHDEGSLSAENLKNVISEMKEENITIIFIGKDDNIKNAELIAKETGAKIYKLNTSVSGTDDNNSYLNALKENIEILKEI